MYDNTNTTTIMLAYDRGIHLVDSLYEWGAISAPEKRKRLEVLDNLYGGRNV